MVKKRKIQTQNSFDISWLLLFANNEYSISGIKATLEKHEKDTFLSGVSEVPEAQPKLVGLLDQIVKNQKVLDTEELRYFIRYCTHTIIKYEVHDGRLVRTPHSRNIVPIFIQILSNNLVGYLSDSRTDIRKLKKCHNCGKFFETNKIDERIKYCEVCSPKSKWSKEKSAKYMRETYRPRKKQEKLAKEREARINRIMQAGWSREEAEEIIEADSKV